MDGEVSSASISISEENALASNAQCQDVLALISASYPETVEHSLGQTIPLPELTSKLKIHEATSSLPTISATESYTEWTGRVVHRFLIIELSGTDGGLLHIRLDRAPAGPLAQTILRKGRAQAGDKVRNLFHRDVPPI